MATVGTRSRHRSASPLRGGPALDSFDSVESILLGMTVWEDILSEMRFYRWAWGRLQKNGDRYGASRSRLDAVTLAYVYAELCYLVCDESFHEDLWYRLGDLCGTGNCFAFSHEEVKALFSESEIAASPDDDADRLFLLIRENHEQIVRGILKDGVLSVLAAFHASWANPQCEDEEGTDDLIYTFEDFCRYADDASFRENAIDEGPLGREYQPAHNWLFGGADFIDPPDWV